MAADLTWFKTTGLACAQNAATAIISATGGTVLNVWDLDLVDLAGIGLGAAALAFLWSVKNYSLPNGKHAAADD